MSASVNRRGRVLVTGATGYIGGRLAPRLLEAGWELRCLCRSPRKLAGRPWAADPRVEVVQGDLGDEEAVERALRGCDAAYYLVHSMLVAGKGYAGQDLRLARGFARCARRAGVRRIVYLGGLGETGADLSEHLRSRRDVEEALRSSGVPVTVLRAAIILGSGSASFEILRYLVERLPVMVAPRWVSTRCQPIAVDDVLHDLVACLDVPRTSGLTLDIGGRDVLSYRDLMAAMARALGLRRRRVLVVPVLSPRLSARWIHLVTPLSSAIALPLADGLRNEVVCRDDAARRLMPREVLGVEEALERALAQQRDGQVETVWSAAGAMAGDPDWAGGTLFEDRRATDVRAPPAAVFRAVTRIGGRNGWYSSSLLWRLRGALDRLAGGPGLRRPRRDPDEVEFGDAVDFWRVVDLRPDRRLLLQAEMRLPGRAWLEFAVEERADGSRLEQVARFRPRGLLGLAYWFAVLPLHGFVFRAMLAGIRARAEGEAAQPTGHSSPST